LHTERRKERRHVWPETVYYSYMVSGERWVRPIPALKSNESKSGFCVYSIFPLAEGLPLKISTSSGGGDENDATVEWCIKLRDDFYKVGLSVSH
jgi:hypothetical protein